MALEDILKRIEQKNKKDIEHIEKEASKQCEVVKKEAEREIKGLKEKSRNETKIKAAKLKEHMLQETRLKIAKGVLKTKSDILDNVFKEALKKLENLPIQNHLTWLEEMIQKVAEPGESEMILSMKSISKQNIEEFLKKVNKKLKGRSRIKLSNEKRETGVGFILKRSRKEINCTFKSLLAEKSNNLRIEISKILF